MRKYVIVLLGLCLLAVYGCRSYDLYTVEKCQPKKKCKSSNCGVEYCYTPKNCYIVKYRGQEIDRCEYAVFCKSAIDLHYDHMNEPTEDERLRDYGIRIVE